MRPIRDARRPAPASLAVFALAALLTLVAWGCSKGSGGPPTGPGTPAPVAFDLGPFGLGASASKTFSAADTTRFGGTIGYHCIPHQPTMSGVVIVGPGGGPSVAVQVGPGNQLRFSPDTARVAVGGTVTWTNVSAMTNHTATQN